MSTIENITFGIELETVIPHAAAVSVGHYHLGAPVTALNAPKFNGQPWSAQADGSIQPGNMMNFRGCEFVSPILKGAAGLDHLIEFVAWLSQIGAKVNASCGCHIHIGVASFQTESAAKSKFVKILARLATRNATALYAQTGTTSREQGRWCRKLGAEDRKQITRACRKGNLREAANDRYRLLNLTNVEGRGTVEFRCFAGTLNIDKILVHLLSVLLLCKVAAGRKSLTNWDPNEELTGTQALHNLLKVRPVFEIVTAPAFRSFRKQMLAKAFEMAGQYDQAKMIAHGAALARASARMSRVEDFDADRARLQQRQNSETRPAV